MNTWIWIILIIAGGYVALRLFGRGHGGHGSHNGHHGGCGGEDEEAASAVASGPETGTANRPHSATKKGKQSHGECC